MLTQPWCWPPQGPPDRLGTSDHKPCALPPPSVAEAGSRPHGHQRSEEPAVPTLCGGLGTFLPMMVWTCLKLGSRSHYGGPSVTFSCW